MDFRSGGFVDRYCELGGLTFDESLLWAYSSTFDSYRGVLRSGVSRTVAESILSALALPQGLLPDCPVPRNVIVAWREDAH